MESWIPLRKVEAVVQLEPALLVIALAVSSWLIYKLFLKGLSPERHRNLLRLFQNLLLHCVYATILTVIFWSLHSIPQASPVLTRLVPTVGFLAILSGCTVFVKTCRILAFEYLFFANMRAGVPLLIVNLFTLVLSLVLGAWILSGLFEFQLAPLLATSAIFSIVLGLALQDTLGNLIAGVALQFDKPYEIGDWIEVQTMKEKFVGQVDEITWRATVLIAFTDEIITIPNRMMAQSEILNFSAKTRPFIRSHLLRIPFTQPLGKVKQIVLDAVAQVPAVRRVPSPLALVIDTSDSWITLKVIYHIGDYGRQYIIADEVYTYILRALEKEGLPLAVQRLTITQAGA